METMVDRKEIARSLLASGMEPQDFVPVAGPEASVGGLMIAKPPKLLKVGFPDKLAPRPAPIGALPSPEAPLPRADVVVITWTVAEVEALASVFTPGFGRGDWYRYSRRFFDHYRPQIRNGAPALGVNRLASYFPTKVGDARVLCMKSELHLNQDGKPTGDGTATLPVRDLFKQIIDEVQPKLVLTVGTSGGVYGDHDLGDVVVTRAAKFRLQEEFEKEPFNGVTYRSTGWTVPTTHLPAAVELMGKFTANLQEPAFCPPTRRYPFAGEPIKPTANTPDIKLAGTGGMPEYHPILTTDFFEFGTSSNNLEAEGCAVEMGDAVLGLACEDIGAGAPHWGVVRNLSDPQINGDLPLEPLNMQTHWAVWYYEKYGYWTSVMGALATWGIIAGYES